MRCTIIFMATLLCAGCTSVPASRAVDDSNNAITGEVVGQACFVSLRSPSPKSSISYEGRVIALTPDVLTIERPKVISRDDSRSPIPGLSGLLRNSAIGEQQLETDVTIPRSQIESVRIAAESP